MKKSFGLLAIIMSVLMLAGCGNGNAIEYVPESEAQPVAVVEEIEPIVSETEVVEPEIEYVEPVVEEEKVEEDPNAVLIVSEEFARAKEIYCLYHDGKLYSLSAIPVENCEKYGYGWYKDGVFGEVVYEDAFTTHDYAQPFESLGNKFITAGSPLEIDCSAGDQIRCYSKYGETCSVRTGYEIIGYTGEFDDAGDYNYIKYFHDKSSLPIVISTSEYDTTNFKMVDDEGNVYFENIGDFSKWVKGGCRDNVILEKDKHYKCTWVGDNFEEHWINFNANCMIVDCSEASSVELAGGLDSENKCYSFDLSSVPEGKYIFGGILLNVSK